MYEHLAPWSRHLHPAQHPPQYPGTRTSSQNTERELFSHEKGCGTPQDAISKALMYEGLAVQIY